jgi:hypothetical protein
MTNTATMNTGRAKVGNFFSIDVKTERVAFRFYLGKPFQMNPSRMCN